MVTSMMEVEKMAAHSFNGMYFSNCTFAAGTSVRARVIMDTALGAVSILISPSVE